jgi:uncharacterized phiE125 gp8 family phage protein
MVSVDALAVGADATAEAKRYLRVLDATEEALIEQLMRAATELCEQFTGQMLLSRGVTQTIAQGNATGWRRLARSPVQAITSVEQLGADGGATLLTSGSYAVDIDANGDGWVRLGAGVGAARIGFTAGLAPGWAQVPEPLRHGVIRMAAHFYAHRDAARAEGPPAAVTALWRPWRRLRLG